MNAVPLAAIAGACHHKPGGTDYMHDPIAYAYDADLHCAPCAVARFGAESGRAWVREDARDAEGNPIGAVAPWDSVPCHSICGTCGEELARECQPDGACCVASGCADCRMGLARHLVTVRTREGRRSSIWQDPYTGAPRYQPARHGRLWHKLTGRTAPEMGQLAAL